MQSVQGSCVDSSRRSGQQADEAVEVVAGAITWIKLQNMKRKLRPRRRVNQIQTDTVTAGIIEITIGIEN